MFLQRLSSALESSTKLNLSAVARLLSEPVRPQYYGATALQERQRLARLRRHAGPFDPGLRKRLRCSWCSTRAIRREQRARTGVACNLEQPTKF